MTTSLLLVAGLLAPILFVAAAAIQGAIQPGYDALTGYVSDLSLGSDGWMLVGSFIVCGWLLLGFSLGLVRLAESREVPRWSALPFDVMGFGLIGAGVFEIDPVWARLSLHGELHYAFTAVTGGSLMLAAILAFRDLQQEGRPVAAAGLLGAALACVVLFAVSLMLPQTDLPGLLERIALLVGALWISGFALSLLHGRRRMAFYARRGWGQLSHPVMNSKRKPLAAWRFRPIARLGIGGLLGPIFRMMPWPTCDTSRTAHPAPCTRRKAARLRSYLWVIGSPCPPPSRGVQDR